MALPVAPLVALLPTRPDCFHLQLMERMGPASLATWPGHYLLASVSPLALLPAPCEAAPYAGTPRFPAQIPSFGLRTRASNSQTQPGSPHLDLNPLDPPGKDITKKNGSKLWVGRDF